jgi:hypothetical protein
VTSSRSASRPTTGVTSAGSQWIVEARSAIGPGVPGSSAGILEVVVPPAPNAVLRGLDRTSRGWPLAVVVAVSVLALHLISSAPWVPFSAAHVADLSGGQGVLDLEFAYDPATGAAALDALGPRGRAAYDRFQIADLVFPATYAVGLGSLVLALWRPWPALALVPVVGAVFDYVENDGVFAALRTFPTPSSTALAVASGAGAVKLVLGCVSLGLVVDGLLLRAVRAIRGRRARRAV